MNLEFPFHLVTYSMYVSAPSSTELVSSGDFVPDARTHLIQDATAQALANTRTTQDGANDTERDFSLYVKLAMAPNGPHEAGSAKRCQLELPWEKRG